jgi:hypothetical protein
VLKQWLAQFQESASKRRSEQQQVQQQQAPPTPGPVRARKCLEPFSDISESITYFQISPQNLRYTNQNQISKKSLGYIQICKKRYTQHSRYVEVFHIYLTRYVQLS